ncbi:MAG: o-succinylbenzoate synthase [Bacteroidetes Order II. Incertae sedis bacterium]|nr:o-succinylbenzoate synthase [Bacteroidetes Order II. bacterium]
MLQELSLFRYQIPFTSPIRMGGQLQITRTGLLLRLTDADGFEGWGEAAPLPGFSHETIPEIVLQLGHLRTKNRLNPPPLPFKNWYPSVKFGLDTAFSDLQSQKNGLPRYNTARKTVRLTMLLTGLPEACVHRAEQAAEQGYQAVKVKVGIGKPAQDAALVRRVAAIMGEGCALRLDANRAWTLKEALLFAEQLHGVPIEYIEEPLKSSRHLPEFARLTGMPIALDESLRDRAWDKLQQTSFRPAVLIYKPMLSVRPASWYLESGLPVVLSSSFESGVGIQALLALASYIGSPDTPIGLDTYNWLREDVLRPRLSLDAPVVDLEESLDRSHCVEVEKLELFHLG